MFEPRTWTYVLSALGLATALPHTLDASPIKCPLIFDGRLYQNSTLTSFNSANLSAYSTQYVHGENLTWTDIIFDWAPMDQRNRFDEQFSGRGFEVSIDDRSLFRSGQGLQLGFRRAGLLFKNDANAVGADAADSGTVTFHWSVQQNLARMLNFTHEYMNVWHEKADYSGNQWTFSTGLLLEVDGGPTANESWTKERIESFRVQDAKNEILFEVPILWRGWQNFAVQLDYDKDTIQIFYSEGAKPLEAKTKALPNDNSGGGQMQLGIAKKPTETKTVVWDGYQEHLKNNGEAQGYGGVFVENSNGGCISL